MRKRPTTDMVNFANTILSGWGDAMNEAMRPQSASVMADWIRSKGQSGELVSAGDATAVS